MSADGDDIPEGESSAGDAANAVVQDAQDAEDEEASQDSQATASAIRGTDGVYFSNESNVDEVRAQINPETQPLVSVDQAEDADRPQGSKTTKATFDAAIPA